LEDPIETLAGIGPKRAALLARLEVRTVRDLLLHVPRAYQDRRRMTPVAEAQPGAEVTIAAEVVSARHVRLRGRLSMAVLRVRDATGEMNVTFFGRGFLARAFSPGTRLVLSGRVETWQGPALKNPEYEALSGDEEDLLHTGRIVPVYRLTEDVTQRTLRRWVATALREADGCVEETLPELLRAAHGLPRAEAAVRDVHFPESFEAAEAARARFVYEELLAMQAGILMERAARAAEGRAAHVKWDGRDGPCLSRLRASLPFALTPAQARAVKDLLDDMAAPRPMLRLLQGDVGCGKTVVALHAVAAAADGGYQSALMAPTEVLAEQHYFHLRRALEPLGLRVGLLTGSMKGAARVRKEVAAGVIDVIVGTHALMQEKTTFHRLGLAIIDEQHRFGVLQRARLIEKGDEPDVLHMTATPIPRTLALTVYGGMDITVIDEMPPGRRPVKTRRVPPGKIPELHAYIARQAAAGRQTYIICPLVDESDQRELRGAIRHFEELSTGPFAGLRTDLLHGRLDASEKETVLRRFQNAETDVLFSTTVIEVGIDVANATTMVIEDAPQFGLTQLHQLRGRVGRGPEQSHCFLIGAPTTEDGRRRLETLCATNDGFAIAEEDLKLRGPGEFHGVRQAGLSDLRVADLVRDARLLDRARRDAQALLERDPRLEDPEHRALAAAARRFLAVRG